MGDNHSVIIPYNFNNLSLVCYGEVKKGLIDLINRQLLNNTQELKDQEKLLNAIEFKDYVNRKIFMPIIIDRLNFRNRVVFGDAIEISFFDVIKETSNQNKNSIVYETEASKIKEYLNANKKSYDELFSERIKWGWNKTIKHAWILNPEKEKLVQKY